MIPDSLRFSYNTAVDATSLKRKYRQRVLVILALAGLVLMVKLAMEWDVTRGGQDTTIKTSGLTSDEHQAFASTYIPEMVPFDIEARDGIKIVTNEAAKAAQLFSYEAAPVEEVARFRPILEDEWRHLPSALVKKSGVKRIVLCTGLKAFGHAVGGVGDALILYYDVKYARVDNPALRRMIHHEFFHSLDHAMNGQVFVDPFSLHLNGENFDYDRSIKAGQLDDSSLILPINAPPGFIDRYSTSGVEEDKAQLFAYLMVSGTKLDDLAKRDAVIAAKRKYLMKMINDFCPEADDKFWEKMKKVPRQQEYEWWKPALGTKKPRE